VSARNLDGIFLPVAIAMGISYSTAKWLVGSSFSSFFKEKKEKKKGNSMRCIRAIAERMASLGACLLHRRLCRTAVWLVFTPEHSGYQ
jgi:hypothetical protein